MLAATVAVASAAPAKTTVKPAAAPAKAPEYKTEVINITTSGASMVLSVAKDGNVLFHHFGGKVSDPSPVINKNYYLSENYGMPPLAYSTMGSRSVEDPALSVTYADGELNTELKYVSHKSESLEGGNLIRTTITLRELRHPLEVQLIYNAYQKENVITCRTVISNKGEKHMTLRNYYSSNVHLPRTKYYLTHFHGSWGSEFMMEEERLTHGVKAIETYKHARPTRTENPSFMLSIGGPLDENAGEVIAGALAWTGNYRISFNIDEADVLTILAGASPYASQYTLDNGKSLETPEMIYTYSNEGAGQATRNLHDWARGYGVYRGGGYTPVLLNNWEGTYFDFDTKTLCSMMDDAASMGIELFVLDDGWFGNNYPRNNDKQGLGDWQVNKKKLPEGIEYLVDYAKSKGMKFGIWIEPEMVNPKSDLYTKHPDWVVRSGDREPTTQRTQLLLDLSNPKVQDFIFGVFDDIMKEAPGIAYIKWDANRHVEGAGSTYLPADRQSHFWAEYTKGLYSVYERIRQKYPNVIVQACSSGGGRCEYGALKYNNEVWTSDCTDPMSRVYIQYGMNMIYPSFITGAHVSASPNHQTNNATPLKFRFDLAMSGRLGMELQPKEMDDKEKDFARMAIANFKKVRDIVFEGDLYRMASPYDGGGNYALMYVTKDKSRAVVYDYRFKYTGNVSIQGLRLRGLDPAKTYKITEMNVSKSRFWGNGLTFSGQYLIEMGINPGLVKMYDSAVFYVEEVK